MKPKRAEPHKIIKHTPKPELPKPASSQEVEAPSKSQKPGGCYFHINKSACASDENPEIDPNHKYAVC